MGEDQVGFFFFFFFSSWVAAAPPGIVDLRLRPSLGRLATAQMRDPYCLYVHMEGFSSLLSKPRCYLMISKKLGKVEVADG